MAETLTAFYKGWDIEIRCVKKRPAFLQSLLPARYVATGTARLRATDQVINWLDTRPQGRQAGEGLFYSYYDCSHGLLVEIFRLIDTFDQ